MEDVSVPCDQESVRGLWKFEFEGLVTGTHHSSSAIFYNTPALLYLGEYWFVEFEQIVFVILRKVL